MTNATAKYILRAEDKTKGAVASALRGFENLDKSAKTLSRGFKALGVGALALKTIGISSAAAQKAIANLAATDAQFAASMAETKLAYQNLWVAGSQAAEAQARLNATLKDPKILGAARVAADGLAAGYTDLKRGALEALAALQRVDAWMGKRLGVYDPAQIASRDYAGLVASQMPAANAAQRLKDSANGPNPYMKLVDAAFARESKEEAERAAKKITDDFNAAIARNAAAWDNMDVSLQTRAETLLKDFKLEDFEEGLGNIAVVAEKTFAEAGVYADQAARNMQDAFADFLFDPFENGVKGMVKSFADAMRSLIANRTAEKLFDAIGSSLGGKGGVLGAIGDLFGGGKAAGGPVSGGKTYLVGERGPELFSPRSSGHITPNHAMGGSVVVNNHVDARGASVELVKVLPGLLKGASDDAVARIQDQWRRGRL